MMQRSVLVTRRQLSSPGSGEISDPRASQVTGPIRPAKSEPNKGSHDQARGVCSRGELRGEERRV